MALRRRRRQPDRYRPGRFPPLPPHDHDIRLAQLREWLGTGMWFIPSLWAIGAMLGAVVMTRLDVAGGGDTPSWLVFGRGADSGRLVLSVIAGSTLTFTGTVFSITIVALQLASTQFSPRVLRAFLRDRGTQHCFGIFIATFLFAVMILREIGAEVEVPGLSITAAFTLVVSSLFAFVYLVHHVSQAVRVVSIIEATAAEARQSIRDNFPTHDPEPVEDGHLPSGPPTMVLNHDRGPGALLGIDEDDLVAVACRHGCILKLLHRVGDFLPSGVSMCEVYGGDGTIRSAEVLRHIGTGPERTLFQDVGFGFRQLVDIAEKALSPAANDPTTAVQCIDRLHDLLRRLAASPFPDGMYGDRYGNLRLIVPQTTWDDLVHLTFDEIRHYGIGSLQIPRRIRAALLDLLTVAPPLRRAALEHQLQELDLAIDRVYADPSERALAHDADEQGLR
ncbi:MAG: DUF2254 domain-containing protein [Acidimicrobiales bacterium]